MEIPKLTQAQQEQQLQKQIHENLLRTREFTSILENIKDRYDSELDYILNESTENRLSDSQLRNKLVEAKATRDIYLFIKNPKSVIRK